ncbi:MAG: type 1 glutamine amidotransferase [Methanoregulaceae archaeon]
MITILQHGPGEAPGHILPILTARAVPFRILHLYEEEEVPSPDSADPIIILGGLMSVNDERDYPFLTREKELIRSLAAKRVPVLGICLGAQMMAKAFGQPVMKADTPEQGWYTVQRANSGLPGHPAAYPVFQWHNDTFALPGEAELLATGSLVRNQAFRIGSCTGVQYHMEATPEIIRNWAQDLPGGARRTITEDTARYIDGSYERCRRILDYFLASGRSA